MLSQKRDLMTLRRRYWWARLSALVAMLLLTLSLDTLPGVRNGRASSLISVSDMAIVTEGRYRDTVFIADGESGKIYYLRLADDSITNRLAFDSFREFPAPSLMVKPTAFASYKGKLFVIDQGANALFEIDLETNSAKVLWRDEAIKDVTTIAISSEGQVAVASNVSGKVFLLKAGADPEVISHDFDKPIRVTFSGQDILVLNKGNEVLKVERTKQSVLPVLLPEGVADALGNGVDLSIYQNIYYMAGKERVISFALNKSGVYRRFDQPLAVSFEMNAKFEPSRILATRNQLFIADEKIKAVRRLPRPVPVDVRFDGSAQRTTIALIELYDYLSTRKMLQAREVVATREYRNLEEVLIDKGVLVSPLPAKIDAPLRAKLGDLLCSLNPDFCARNKTTGEKILGKQVASGDKIILPDISVDEYVTSRRTALNGKPIKEYLDEIFPIEAEQAQFASRERLARLNPPTAGTAYNADIYKQKTGYFNLPVKRWQATVLALTDDLQSETSPLRKLDDAYADMHVLSKEDFLIKPTGSSALMAFQPGSQSNTPEAVLRNREELKQEIHFPKKPVDGSRFIIGIGEATSSVDFNHPDFIDENGESMWFEPTIDASDVLRHAVDPARVIPPRDIGKKFLDSDHGTHVAGLLASRPNGLVPGLLSSAKGLLLVDNSNPAELHEIIEAAKIAGPVFIFNFSFTLPNAATDAKVAPLKQKLMGDWKECLFVVAAGNAMGTSPAEQDLSVSANPPIAWIEDVRNMIGVGSSSFAPGAGEFLMNPFIENGISHPGSKYGKRFVHLVAPGRAIFSQAKENSYKEATGTSQAVPQVTAAAAMLFALKITDPVVIKARLIYTSDWFSSFQDKVYGGLLNVERAIREPDRDLFTTLEEPTKIKAINIDGNPEIRATGQVDEPRETGLSAPRTKKIKFRDIYRIARQPGPANLVRVFYLDRATNKLRVMNNAELTGKIKCRKIEELDETSGTFLPPMTCGEMDISEFFDYVINALLVPSTIGF